MEFDYAGVSEYWRNRGGRGQTQGFWGILKRECYYGHTFTSRKQLISTIESYIDYYNNRRYQHRLFVQTPMQAHVSAMNRAA